MDLKPPNILLRDSKNPVILDFGISKVVEIAWGSLSMSTGNSGTPRYMAPEKFSGKPLAKSELHKIDIWAVGVLFYEILVAAHPFNILQSDSYPQMIKKIADNEIIDLRDFDEQVDPILAEICHRALSKKTEGRYQNAQEMLHDLNQWETINFKKCIALAQEHLKYRHWRQAQQSVMQAHLWAPFAPQVKDCLEQVLSGQYHRQIRIEWITDITPAIMTFWLQTRNDPEFTASDQQDPLYPQ